MTSRNEFKLYNKRNDLTGEMYERIDCMDDKQFIFDRVLKIKFYFSNGENYSLNEVLNFDFDLKKEINIESSLFVPSIYNMQFEQYYINKIVVDGLLVDVCNSCELLYFTTEFTDLNIYNINGCFNTNSNMRIILRFRNWESL